MHPSPETKVETEVKIVDQTENKSQSNIETESPKFEDGLSEDNKPNWKKFREEQQKQREQRDEALRRAKQKEDEALALKAAMEAILNKPTQKQQEANDYEELSDEERIDRRVEMALKQREAQYQKEKEQREHAEYPQRLQSNYQDFSNICSTENLDYLQFHYPEVTDAYKQTPDSYQKWESIYKAIKRFVPNTDTRKDIQKAQNNANKPKSLSAPSIITTGQTMSSYRLDEAKKAENWARMKKILETMDK